MRRAPIGVNVSRREIAMTDKGDTMIQKRDRVRHSNVAESFGVGTVLEINEKANTALVEWDAHEVTRETKKLAKHQTHVNLNSLIKV